MPDILVEPQAKHTNDLIAEKLKEAGVDIPVAALEQPEEGLENHHVGGDISKCTFLNSIGAVGLDQTVNRDQVDATPAEGTAVREILAEKRRQRAEAKALQAKQAPASQVEKELSVPTPESTISYEQPITEMNELAHTEQFLVKLENIGQVVPQSVPKQPESVEKEEPITSKSHTVVRNPEMAEVKGAFIAPELPVLAEVTEVIESVVIPSQAEKITYHVAPKVSVAPEVSIESEPEAVDENKLALSKNVEEPQTDIIYSTTNTQSLEPKLPELVSQLPELPINDELHIPTDENRNDSISKEPVTFTSPEATAAPESLNTMVQEHIAQVIEQEPGKKAAIIELVQELAELSHDQANNSEDLQVQLGNLLGIKANTIEGVELVVLTVNLLLQEDIDEPTREALLSYLNRIGTGEHRHTTIRLKSQNHLKISSYITQLLRPKLADAVA